MKVMSFTFKKTVINDCIVYIAKDSFSNNQCIVGIHLFDFEYIKTIQIYIDKVIKAEIPIKKAGNFFFDNPISFTSLEEITIKRIE